MEIHNMISLNLKWKFYVLLSTEDSTEIASYTLAAVRMNSDSEEII